MPRIALKSLALALPFTDVPEARVAGDFLRLLLLVAFMPPVQLVLVTTLLLFLLPMHPLTLVLVRLWKHCIHNV